jgi:hypothetical protein
MASLFNYFPTVPASLAHEIKTQVKGKVTVGFSGGETIAIIEPQPVSADELKMLEPGERLFDYKRTWTRIAVVPTDEITYKGIKYRVHQVDDRDEFYRVVMRRKVSNVA